MQGITTFNLHYGVHGTVQQWQEAGVEVWCKFQSQVTGERHHTVMENVKETGLVIALSL